MLVAGAAAVLVTGYAVVRVGDIALGTHRASVGRPGYDGQVVETLTDAGLAVLAPLGLALVGLALAAVLARRSRWLAAAGAALLAATSLPQVDAALGWVPVPPGGVGDRTALFASYAVAPWHSGPDPVPALTAAVTLAAYALLVIGLTGDRAPAPAR
ncbi:MAG TPA: hypothetical protein VNV66_03075 [Pilimelia sp.]|nr:hypothetical protein [Pilimelia sp.]